MAADLALTVTGIGVVLVFSGLVWLWLIYSDEPSPPEEARWHCFEPGPPCTPNDPCSPSCGYPIGTLR